MMPFTYSCCAGAAAALAGPAAAVGGGREGAAPSVFAPTLFFPFSSSTTLWRLPADAAEPVAAATASLPASVFCLAGGFLEAFAPLAAAGLERLCLLGFSSSFVSSPFPFFPISFCCCCCSFFVSSSFAPLGAAQPKRFCLLAFCSNSSPPCSFASSSFPFFSFPFFALLSTPSTSAAGPPSSFFALTLGAWMGWFLFRGIGTAARVADSFCRPAETEEAAEERRAGLGCGLPGWWESPPAPAGDPQLTATGWRDTGSRTTLSLRQYSSGVTHTRPERVVVSTEEMEGPI
mmetsp:Transcript_35016/g.99250  ORF Transcript_35016/g.99250 Transcript_35016/m.99250 type:complete len:290 (-) Transcript_35016:292-1161(-)